MGWGSAEISQPKGTVQRIQPWLQLQDRLHGKGAGWKAGCEGAVHGPARAVIPYLMSSSFWCSGHKIQVRAARFHSEPPESGEQ